MRPRPTEFASVRHAPDMAELPDPYKVLQVDSEADPEVIQAAYRRLAQKYHPDLAANPEAARRMVAINEAWSILRDPESRAAFDRRRGLGARQADGATRVATAADAGHDARPTGSPRSTGEPEPTSGDWGSGRSTKGGGYDPRTMRAAEGFGAAGPPPGNASGTVLPFGRFAGWSLGEVARRDIDYIEWLDRMPIGRPYRDEIDGLLRQAGRRRTAQPDAPGRRGLFRRR
jgi:curved DNA-binding protein CbpA